MHYPPFCSKFNPIEHRVSAHITRSWKGVPLFSIEDAAERAAKTTTAKGLTVNVDINLKTYDIKRSIDGSYKKRLRRELFFRNNCPNGITLLNRHNMYKVIF